MSNSKLHLGIVASMKSGLGQFVFREICQLEAQGARITLFPTKHRRGLYNPRSEWEICYWSKWRVILCQPLRWLKMPFRYVAVFAEAWRLGALADFLLAAYFVPWMRDCDVIYSTFGDRKLFVGYFGKRLLSKPLAVEIHSGELYVNPNPQLFAVALAACDRIIAVTEHNREILISRYAVAPERVEVVRLSVDLDEFRPSKKFVILIVAFFGETKGHDVLFQAVKKMGREDVEVWVVGGSDGRSEFVDVPALARDLGVESQVAFFGSLSGAALRAVYHACDVFCLPCRPDSDGSCEGFPVVLMEAMACGKPVITTRHVEIPRIVEHIVVTENDVNELTAALERVYASASLRRELGERNRELAERHFAPTNATRTMTLLSEIANASDHAVGGSLPPSRPNGASVKRLPVKATAESCTASENAGAMR